MDSRVTLNLDESFLEILETSFTKGEKVYLLLDENGLVRAEGFVTAIHKNPVTTSIELEGKKRIDLKTIVAVNGIFKPEYGGC